MSKKKNTLKDLDEFLKQQAAVIVPPSALNEKIDTPFPESPSSSSQGANEVTAEKVIHALNALSRKEGDKFREKLYDIIIKSLEANAYSTPEDKVLINTALYLKSGDNWKTVIRAYWKASSMAPAREKDQA